MHRRSDRKLFASISPVRTGQILYAYVYLRCIFHLFPTKEVLKEEY